MSSNLTVTLPIELYEELREATIFASVEARIAADRLPHSAYYAGKCASLLDLLDRASLANVRIGSECEPPPGIDRLHETPETQRVADRLERRER